MASQTPLRPKSNAATGAMKRVGTAVVSALRNRVFVSSLVSAAFAYAGKQIDPVHADAISGVVVSVAWLVAVWFSLFPSKGDGK